MECALAPTTSPTHGVLEAVLDGARAAYGRQFGGTPAWEVVAPGRVNLIGEHVDYNEGFVLPMAIERQVVVVGGPKAGPVARVASTAQGSGVVEVPLTGVLGPGEPRWANYVRGVIAGFRAVHPEVPGFHAVVHGDLPLGGGLSSSAALEVGTCLLLEAATGHTLEARDRVRLCQKAEHDFAGVPCGIMDQFVVATAREGHALLLDCRTLEARPVAFADPAVALLVTHCGVAHELGKGEYARRRADCEAAARGLGLSSLRQAGLDQLLSANGRLPANAFKRARHVIGEIARTLEFARAIETRDWAEAGRLMYASHASLRDDYEVSCAELDLLVALARGLGEAGGVYGARMTGGGFGGCTVTLVRADAATAVGQQIQAQYRARTGIDPQWFVSRPAAGARIVRAAVGRP